VCSQAAQLSGAKAGSASHHCLPEATILAQRFLQISAAKTNHETVQVTLSQADFQRRETQAGNILDLPALGQLRRS
jgi:hypothetical protein